MKCARLNGIFLACCDDVARGYEKYYQISLYLFYKESTISLWLIMLI